jgi:hypothetical protein
MLAEFQQALVDLTAAPVRCAEMRRDPAPLRLQYDLTDREFDRLVKMLRHPGMRCGCVVYRANRLAPLVMNAPDTCRSLGPGLRPYVDEFWEANPETNVHFFIETDRFCRFMLAKAASDDNFPRATLAHLRRESADVAAALEESRTEALGTAAAPKAGRVDRAPRRS